MTGETSNQSNFQRPVMVGHSQTAISRRSTHLLIEVVGDPVERNHESSARQN
jgi:hypothetical protein